MGKPTITTVDDLVPRGDDRHAIRPFDDAPERFEERGELGRGGMGRVADAYDHALGRRVAVKHVLADDDGTLVRFEREACITAQLEHPGIVPIYEAGRGPDGRPYYVMRRIDGRPLDEAVRSATLDQRLALVPNVLAACDAVAAAHARGIVHRDLKPANILLGPFGETLVIDWGLALRNGDDSFDHVAGTPGYMAPEQARGERVDARADVFALGATLFCVLAGTAPFAGAGGSSTQIAHVAKNAEPSWAALPNGVPDELRAIIAKALRPERDARYPDAAALAADLRRFVTGNLVAAHRYGVVAQLRRFVRRHRTAVAVGTASLLVIAAIGTLAVRRVIAERDEARAARARETDRALDLTFAQAWLLLATNPTRAVAIVKPYAGGPRWREAAGVIAAARAAGVAWRLPSSAVTWRAGVADDGHAFSVGGDGTIWLYDLGARTGAIAHRLGRTVDAEHRAIVELLPGRVLAVFEGDTLSLIGPAGRRAITLPAPAARSGSKRDLVYWIDRDGHAWRLAGDRPQPLLVDDEVLDVHASPDGGRFAIRGAAATWLYANDTATRILDERAAAIAWHADGNALAVATERQGKLVRIALGVSPPSLTELGGRGWPSQIVVAHGQLYRQSPNALVAGASQVASYLRAAGLGLARDELVVAGASDGVIDVFDGPRRHRLVMPDAQLDLVTTNPHSQYVLAIAGAAVLAWDLDDVIARRHAIADATRIDSVGSQLLVATLNTQGTWLDLHTFARTPGPTPPLGVIVVPGSRGAALIERDGRVHFVRTGAPDDVVIASNGRHARFLDERRLVVLSRDGRVAIHDVDARSTTPVDLPARPARRLHARGDTIAVVYEDASVTRLRIGGAQSSLPRVPDPNLVALAPDGNVYFADGAVLWRWDLDGRIAPRHELAAPIQSLFVVGDAHVAADTDEAGYLIDVVGERPPVRTPRLGTMRQPGPDGAPIYSIPSTTAQGLVAIPALAGGAVLLDATTGRWWTVGQSGGSPTTAVLAHDGGVLYERRGDELAVWRIDLARSPSAAVDQATRLTNAALADDGTLRW